MLYCQLPGLVLHFLPSSHLRPELLEMSFNSILSVRVRCQFHSLLSIEIAQWWPSIQCDNEILWFTNASLVIKYVIDNLLSKFRVWWWVCSAAFCFVFNSSLCFGAGLAISRAPGVPRFGRGAPFRLQFILFQERNACNNNLFNRMFSW